MPLFPEKKQHVVQFLLDSPNSGTLFRNKIVWNAQGDLIRLFGKFIGQRGLGEKMYSKVFPNTSTWRHLHFSLLDYKQFYEDTTTDQHIFGELTNFMSMYPEY